MEVHHTGERRCESHPVRNRSVPMEAHHLVLLSHVVEETGRGRGISYHFVCNSTQIFWQHEAGKSQGFCQKKKFFREQH